MTKAECIGLFRKLSYSQGYYGRLLQALEELEEEEQEDFFSHFEDCKTELDVILQLEG
jgi:hypothetical protein